jgi:hypothetical protein
LTVAIAFVVFLPHLIWLYYAGFWTTTDYAIGRQKQSYQGMITHFSSPVIWIVNQIILLLASPLLLLIPYLGHKWKVRLPQSELEKETSQYLLCCLAFPFVMITFVAGVAGTHAIAAHGIALWFFLGVYLLLQFQRQESPAVFWRTLRWTSFVVFVLVIVFIVQAVASPYLTGTARRFHFPMWELGKKCEQIWDSRFDSPCPYISGLWFYAGNAAYAMKDRPSVLFYYGSIENPNALPTGTWATDEDVNQKGGIILWEASEQIPDWVHRRFPKAEVLPEILELRYKTGADIPAVKIGIAIVPPSGRER